MPLSRRFMAQILTKYACFMVHIRPKFMHIAPQCGSSTSSTCHVMCLFRVVLCQKKCHKRVFNVSVFNTSCNILLSYHFKSEILNKYTRFMVLYARNSRVLLRNCTCFTFLTGLVMYPSYRLTSKILPKHTCYAFRILLNTLILSWKYDRNLRVLLRKCIRFTS